MMGKNNTHNYFFLDDGKKTTLIITVQQNFLCHTHATALTWMSASTHKLCLVGDTTGKTHIRPRPLVPVTALAGTNVQI